MIDDNDDEWILEYGDTPEELGSLIKIKIRDDDGIQVPEKFQFNREEISNTQIQELFQWFVSLTEKNKPVYELYEEANNHFTSFLWELDKFLGNNIFKMTPRIFIDYHDLQGQYGSKIWKFHYIIKLNPDLQDKYCITDKYWNSKQLRTTEHIENHIQYCIDFYFTLEIHNNSGVHLDIPYNKKIYFDGGGWSVHLRGSTTWDAQQEDERIVCHTRFWQGGVVGKSYGEVFQLKPIEKAKLMYKAQQLYKESKFYQYQMRHET